MSACVHCTVGGDVTMCDIYREREYWVCGGFIDEQEEPELERCAGCGQFIEVHLLVNGYCAECRNIDGE
jgi:hypothetical protein